jgi:hypothetical protein
LEGEIVSKWTHFWDMHSGGRTKEPPYEQIFIEMPEKEAISVFYTRFGHNPYRITCTCCGEDYSISEWDSLAEATSYFRNASVQEDGTEKFHNNYCGDVDDRRLISVDELKKNTKFLFIYNSDISRNEATIRELPEEGWTWQ